MYLSRTANEPEGVSSDDADTRADTTPPTTMAGELLGRGHVSSRRTPPPRDHPIAVDVRESVEMP